MVFVTIIIVGVAGAMLGWNVHVMRKHGVCCPPPSAEGTQAASSRSMQDGKLRRRRPRSSSSRSRGSHDRDAEARRKARAMAVAAGVSSRKVAMDPVQEQQEEEVRGPSSGADVPAVAAAVNGGA